MKGSTSLDQRLRPTEPRETSETSEMGEVDDLDETFASDNCATVHPEVLSAIADANVGSAGSYGADRWTARLGGVARSLFGPQASIHPVFNGTGANVIALHAMAPKWGAVICGEWAHAATDEGGAPEHVATVKLLTVPTSDGKLTPELIDSQAWGFGDEHRAQPAAVSITQSTELGTTYTPDEIRRISDHAHALGLGVHVDGARLANAAAHLGCELRAITTDVGVDVVSLGGTKNGGLCAEAILVLNQAAVSGLAYLRKTDTQLASKMRFLSAQLLALYGGDLWLRCARHSNAMASRLAEGISTVEGVRVTREVQANAVFATVPPALADSLRTRYEIVDWGHRRGEVRLMCAWSTTEAEVDELVAECRRAVHPVDGGAAVAKETAG